MGARHFSFAFILLCAAVMQGCVTVDNRVRYRDGEGVFARDWFDLIVPGRTSYQQLLGHYGPPFRTLDGPDSGQLASWEFLRQQQKRTAVFGLISYTDTEESRHYLHVVLRNGIVVRRWQDRTRDVDAAAVFQAVGLRELAPVEESQGLLPGIGAGPPDAPLRARDIADEKTPAPEEALPEATPVIDPPAPAESVDGGFVRPL